MSAWARSAFLALLLVCLPAVALSQANYTAQLTGTVTDSSGGVVIGAKVALTDEGTNIASNTVTDDRGVYTFTGIRPASYTLRVEAPNFAAVERKGLVLAVNQQATLDLTLVPGAVSESVTVTTQAPLLDAADASLGTDVTNEYVRDIPLTNRSFFGLVFLAGGVTETAGQGTQDSYPSGTNFVSNGQRNATAEVRLDGALTSAPEQGEGSTTNVYYQPSVEIVQEFKVENNSFSAEFGNNGGTVINIVLKEGGNRFHGSGWWFGQRSALDANDFFSNAQGIAKPDHARDQYGLSFSGPIKKEKTFFFFDYEQLRENDPVHIDAFVPTTLERGGDFRNTFVVDNNTGNTVQQRIFNPFSFDPSGNRSDFTVPNLIDSNLIDPIGQAIINLYPMPTDPNAGPGVFNYHQVVLSKTSGHQFDFKVDHHFSDRHRISARYSNLHNVNAVPTVFGDGDTFSDGFDGTTDVHNASIEDDFSLSPTVVWTSRFSVDRAVAPVTENYPDVSSVFNQPGDQILTQANGAKRFPTIQMDNNATSLFSQCCTDTGFAHTLATYSSSLAWVKGRHVWKFGGEQRLFYNNFSQPQNPTGLFHFTPGVTEQVIGAGDSLQGNSFASLLLGYFDTDSHLTVAPSVANKSKETAFYFQDDWKFNSKLTLNLGVRYEWSTPYNERRNAIQFSDFTGDSGIALPYAVSSPYGGADLLNRTGNLIGTTIFAGSGQRNSPVDRNNIAPRIGFAYAMTPQTVIRGGAGIYYGLNVATNFQFVGTAFGNTNNMPVTTDNFQTQEATLENPFPRGFSFPQGAAAGATALYGEPNNNSLDTFTARNAEIYQWNLGVQHLFPGQIVIGVDYSASRSTHLPYSSFSGTANRNFLPSSLRQQIVDQYNACLAAPPAGGCVTPTNALNNPTDNPFQNLFATQIDDPSSIYNDAQIPLVNLLRPFPQFNGPFAGLTLLGASASYNSMQLRFQKRASHYVSFEGSYTLSKSLDNSSAGANSFITNSLSSGIPQLYDNLNAEKSISANDATHRMVLATIVDLPVGRNRWIGRNMNRVLDAVIGGWSASAILTLQTGTPVSIVMDPDSALLIDGNQRPDVVCSQVSSGISYHQAAATGQPVFNASCFDSPGDEVPGNAPRYFSNLRSEGIHNTDLSFSKEFTIREGMKLQFRGEFFNFTNTPRFNLPESTGLGSADFGLVTSTLGTPRHTQIGLRFEF